MLDPLKVVTDGIKQFNGKAFRIATLQKEYIVVTQADQVAEYIRAPDNVLNMLEAADEVSLVIAFHGLLKDRSLKHNPLATTNPMDDGLWCHFPPIPCTSRTQSDHWMSCNEPAYHV